jgi:hypothetical protein
LDYAGHALEVEQHITYVNTTPGSLAALPLVVEARRYPGAFQLLSVNDSHGVRFSDFQWKDTLLTLALPAELAPGEAARFTPAYSLGFQPDTQARAFTLGYNSQQVIIGDTLRAPSCQAKAGWHTATCTASTWPINRGL